jgi:hypothetical protein
LYIPTEIRLDARSIKQHLQQFSGSKTRARFAFVVAETEQ